MSATATLCQAPTGTLRPVLNKRPAPSLIVPSPKSKFAQAGSFAALIYHRLSSERCSKHDPHHPEHLIPSFHPHPAAPCPLKPFVSLSHSLLLMLSLFLLHNDHPAAASFLYHYTRSSRVSCVATCYVPISIFPQFVRSASHWLG